MRKASDAFNWTPENLSTALWLDATDISTITLNGSNVSQWDDKSGNGRNASQATATNQPTYVINGINGGPMVKGDNVNDVLFGPMPINKASDITVVMVASLIETSDNLFDIHLSTDQTNNRIGNVGNYIARFNTFAQPVEVTALVSLVPNVVSATHFNSAPFGQRFDAFVGGSRLSGYPTDILVDNPFTTGQFNRYAILDDNTGANAWDGGLGEYFIAITNSTTDRQKLEGYLAHKWGLEANLPANHPYKDTPPQL